MEQSIYLKRRQRLAQKIEGGIAILPAAKLVQRSNDTEFPFRQDSDYYYFTGLSEPDSILIISNLQGKTQTALFVRPKVPEMELWTGKRLGVKGTQNLTGIDEVYSLGEWTPKIKELLLGHESVFINLFEQKDLVNETLGLAKDLSFAKKRKSASPKNFRDLRALTGDLRLIKDSHEITLMREGLKVTQEAHQNAMMFARPEVYEYQVQAILEYTFKFRGNGPGAYDSIVAGGNNANILHYINNDCLLKNGDLLLIDAGVEYKLYATDITRTFPVNGKFSSIQKDLYQLVLDSQEKAFEKCVVGSSLPEVHETAVNVLSQGLIDLGVFDLPLSQVIEQNKLKEFYPHGTGHWLGIDVHDNCPYNDDNWDSVKFSEGMVITVEPGLYFDRDKESTPEKFAGIGIRIEDNILIKKEGLENLSSHIPKQINEIEDQCQMKGQLPC